MQPEKIIQNPLDMQTAHPNYKRIVILVAVIFVMIVATAFVYQYFESKKSARLVQEQLRSALQVERIDQAKEYFEKLTPRSQETADKDRNASKDFFKSIKPSDTPSVDQETKDFFQNNNNI